MQWAERSHSPKIPESMHIQVDGYSRPGYRLWKSHGFIRARVQSLIFP